MSSANQYVRQYSSFRGVDFTSDPVDVADNRVQNAINMWRDYENGNGDMIETFPGFREVGNILKATVANENKVYGMHHYRVANKNGAISDYLIVHIDNVLCYRDLNVNSNKFKPIFSSTSKDSSNRDEVAGQGVTDFMAANRSVSVMANNKLWILDGEKIVCVSPITSYSWDGTSIDLIADTSISITVTVNDPLQYGDSTSTFDYYTPIAYSDGEMYEAANMMSNKAYERFNNEDFDKAGHGIHDASSVKTTYQLLLLDTVESVTLNNVALGTTSLQNGASYSFNEATKQLVIDGVSKDYLKGKELKILGTFDEISIPRTDRYPAFVDSKGDSQTMAVAISKCTKICVFDGKIFVTGNPLHPNTVFFTSTNLTGYNDPTYWGMYNFINTGIGATKNAGFATSQGVLMVFKGDTAQDGSIYYISPVDTGFDPCPRFYAVTEGNAGVGCIGGAVNFMDDVVFISKRGLDAVSKLMTNMERSIVHRSSMVDRKLLGEKLANVRMVEWKGYLVIAIEGRLYLADSRAMYADATGNAQYEWFYIDGIGDYKRDDLTQRYRYASGGLDRVNDFVEGGANEEYDSGEHDKDGPKHPYSIKYESSDEIVEDESKISWDVWNKYNTTIKVYYSTETDENGAEVRYLAYLDEEKIPKDGAQFYPLKEMCVINDILYFTTELDGRVYCINTDKRGEVPKSVMDGTTIVDIDYDSKADFVGKIPQEYYTFNGRRYISGLITKADNVGVPYAEKNTINRSLVIRCGADTTTNSGVHVEVSTDKKVFHEVEMKDSSGATFSQTDFTATTFNTYPFAFLIYREKERKWIEKQFMVRNDSYKGILRIHSLSYRYEIGGKIRR
jgi:hypothetical protein